MTASAHTPVLVAEVLAQLAPGDGGIYIDGTYGNGGYSRALLAAARCNVWGIDRDPTAVAEGARHAADHDGRLNVIEGRFGAMDGLLAAHGVPAVDGIALDLGVSSMQIDRAERGFSFRHDGPLDMRMEGAGTPASDVVNETPERELADIIFRFGEERHARRVARAIVAARRQEPITHTLQLADIVRGAVPGKRDQIDPATRTFQALRIHVNDELGELQRGLPAAERLLGPGGRLAVVSFHSLEDRIVKQFFRLRSGGAGRSSRHHPDGGGTSITSPTFRTLTRRPVTPSYSEIAENPRARSARLRAAERTEAPAWPEGVEGTA